jgi:hypothetical protein
LEPVRPDDRLADPADLADQLEAADAFSVGGEVLVVVGLAPLVVGPPVGAGFPAMPGQQVAEQDLGRFVTRSEPFGEFGHSPLPSTSSSMGSPSSGRGRGIGPQRASASPRRSSSQSCRPISEAVIAVVDGESFGRVVVVVLEPLFVGDDAAAGVEDPSLRRCR